MENNAENISILIDKRSDGAAVVGWKEPVSLDAADADELRERLGQLTSERSQIVIDMSNVEFLDSSIIGALVGSMRAARENGGDVKLAKVNPDVQTVFELTRLDRVFRIHVSVDEALREYGSSI